MANPSLQIGNSNWAIKEDNLLGYSTAGTRFVPQPITMTRESAGTRVNSSGLVETVELLGSNVVINGDFATDSDWLKETGWTISGGSGNCDGSQTGISSLTPNAENVTNGVLYKATYTISNYSSGSIRIKLGNTGFGQYNSSNGTYTEYITAIATSFPRSQINADVDFIGSIDNVSVKEVTKNNLARVDYDGTASSLLVEPERTNLITYSSDFSESSWTKLGSATVIADTTISPDGTLNADSFSFTTSTSDKIQQTVTVVASQQYTVSCYIKSDSNITIKMGGAAASTPINVTTEWVRHTVIQTNGAGTTAYPQLTSNGTEGTIYVYGFQLEQGSYPTSYIPTDGGTVTRVQDQYSKTGISNLINSPEGSFFIEMAALNQPPFSQISISLSGDSSNDRLLIFSGSGGGEWICQFRKDSLSYVQIQKSATITNQSKIAVSWKSGKYLMYIDGDKATNYQAGSETTSTTFEVDDLKNLQFSPNHNASSNLFYGKVKQLQVFKTALTPTELIALTT